MALLQGVEVDHRPRCMTYISIFTTPAQRPLYTALISAYVSHRLVSMVRLEY